MKCFMRFSRPRSQSESVEMFLMCHSFLCLSTMCKHMQTQSYTYFLSSHLVMYSSCGLVRYLKIVSNGKLRAQNILYNVYLERRD